MWYSTHHQNSCLNHPKLWYTQHHSIVSLVYHMKPEILCSHPLPLKSEPLLYRWIRTKSSLFFQENMLRILQLGIWVISVILDRISFPFVTLVDHLKMAVLDQWEAQPPSSTHVHSVTKSLQIMAPGGITFLQYTRKSLTRVCVEKFTVIVTIFLPIREPVFFAAGLDVLSRVLSWTRTRFSLCLQELLLSVAFNVFTKFIQFPQDKLSFHPCIEINHYILAALGQTREAHPNCFPVRSVTKCLLTMVQGGIT